MTYAGDRGNLFPGDTEKIAQGQKKHKAEC